MVPLLQGIPRISSDLDRVESTQMRKSSIKHPMLRLRGRVNGWCTTASVASGSRSKMIQCG
jgi:hypothetical protein